MRLFFSAVLLFVPVFLSAQLLTLDQKNLYDNAVLQQGVEIPVSGTADHSLVSICFGEHKQTVEVGQNGVWTAKIPPQKAGGPYTLKVQTYGQICLAQNILVGEVWLVSGQSNADFPLKKFAPHKEWLKDSDYPRIRYIKTTWQPPHMRVPDQWKICSPETAENFSAAGFFFAKALQKSMNNVPVGIIVAAQDGSIIQKWVPENVLKNVPGMPEMMAKHKIAEQNWQAYQQENSRRKKLPENERNSLPELKRPPYPAKMYSTLFNDLVQPLIPFPVKGVIWYQGESDAMFANGYRYRFLLTELIREWRRLWNTELPFLIVQLPPYGNPVLWADLRDSQNYVASREKQISLISTLDIGDTKDIHPPKKEELGSRLASAALHDVYGRKEISGGGPVMESCRTKGNQLEVRFHPGSPIVSSDGQELRGFTLAGEDRKFYPAKAEIKDDYTLVLTSEKVKSPVAVRYAWTVPDKVNFFNRAGNPAPAFRSDDWKLPTQPAPAKGK